jgi:hypothetical protein
MRRFFTERNLAIVLFLMVIITFSFAQRDSKKIEKLYMGVNAEATPSLTDNNLHENSSVHKNAMLATSFAGSAIP